MSLVFWGFSPETGASQTLRNLPTPKWWWIPNCLLLRISLPDWLIVDKQIAFQPKADNRGKQHIYRMSLVGLHEAAGGVTRLLAENLRIGKFSMESYWTGTSIWSTEIEMRYLISRGIEAEWQSLYSNLGVVKQYCITHPDTHKNIAQTTTYKTFLYIIDTQAHLSSTPEHKIVQQPLQQICASLAYKYWEEKNWGYSVLW